MNHKVAALCFAKSSIDQSGHAGKNSIDYYAATVYGTTYLGDGYLEVGLAGALDKIENKRRVQFPQFNGSLFEETAKSSYWAVQMAPHLALGYDVNFSSQTLEFFGCIDYNLSFLPSFSESKASPLNMHELASFSFTYKGEFQWGLSHYLSNSLLGKLGVYF